MSARKKLEIAAIVAAATIGEGVFALPYVIASAGWLVAVCWFAVLIAAVSVAHAIYLRTLAGEGEKERLLGLAKKYFGRTGFWAGFAAIVLGLMLGFVAYLVLGARFVGVLMPGIPAGAALAIFWFLFACLVWGSEGKIAGVEVAGIALIALAIFFIFFTGAPAAAIAAIPAAVPSMFFLPFGAILFSVAGWTSVEQVYELTKKDGMAGRGRGIVWLFAAGTAIAAILYWLFAFGVIGTVPVVTPDTVSGIAVWPVWRKDILAIVGLASMFVVSLPISREIRGALEKDLRWNGTLSRAVIVLLPLAAVLSGITNFLAIVSIAGGVFLAAQYLLIIFVGRRALVRTPREKLVLDVIALIFICAAVYEFAIFVVH